ncbi:MAG: hypothetical protein WAN35_03475 [Terracidiphilus sp.]
MSLDEKAGRESGMDGASKREDELTPDLEAAIGEFRLSVHAWSEAAMSRPRPALAAAPRRQVWRLTAGWALGCVLVAGGLTAGVFEHHQQQMKIAQARLVEQQRLAAEQSQKQARQDDEELLAKVDSDISRSVPSAMEPLAQLMAGDETR